MDVEQAADQLYALAPADFTARRAELAAEARLAGLSGVAKEIAELRRPTVSAGLINRLTRSEPDDQPEPPPDDPAGDRPMEQLRTLGVQLREAQAKLDGPAMKELTRQRHDLVAALVRRAAEIAADSGQKVSGSVQRELEETFGAAVADEQASLVVTSGRLTRALVYAGFGEVDVTAATATPLSRIPRSPAKPSKATRPQAQPDSSPTDGDDAKAHARAAAEARAEAETAKLRDAAGAARTALEAAEADLATAARHRDAAQAHEAELADRLDDLQREILRTRHDLDAASRQSAAADRDHQRQDRQVRDARKAAQQADQALARLNPTN